MEDRKIELEGTRARVRLLEQLQKHTNEKSPDLIPTMVSSTSDEHRLSRSEITTASMKAMGPLPLNLQLDHSSSTESAHDQAESARKGENSKKRPSKIPLVKSYAAPKPPGGKHSPAPGARSRSGDSLGRPHSAQSWRNKSEGSSLSGSKSNNGSLSKSRNGSLSNAKDSLGGKYRENNVPTNGNINRNNTLRKQMTPVRRTNSIRDSPDAKVRSKLAFWNWLKINNNPT